MKHFGAFVGCALAALALVGAGAASLTYTVNLVWNAIPGAAWYDVAYQTNGWSWWYVNVTNPTWSITLPVGMQVTVATESLTSDGSDSGFGTQHTFSGPVGQVIISGSVNPFVLYTAFELTGTNGSWVWPWLSNGIFSGSCTQTAENVEFWRATDTNGNPIRLNNPIPL